MSKSGYQEFIKRIKYDLKDAINRDLGGKISSNKQDDDDVYKEERIKTKGEYERKLRKKSYENETKTDKDTWFLKKIKEGETLSRIVEKLINLESDFLDIKEPNYLFYHTPKSKNNEEKKDNEDIDEDIEYGYYDDDLDTIYINLDFNTSYWELFDTVIHEIRHKYQYTVMGKSEDYSEIHQKTAEYLKFSKETYPYNEKDSLYDEKYENNGLESDTSAYTSSRMEIYLEQNKNPEDILSRNTYIERIVKNQILMNPGDSNVNGGRAPISVSKTFEEKEFASYYEKKILKEREEKNMSGGTGATDFSEKAQGAAVKKYGDMIEHIQVFSKKMIEGLLERVKNHPYEQLENVINTFIYYYNEELPSEIKSAIDEWIESDNSFSSSLKKHNAGNAASISAAERLQEHIKDKVDESFKQMDSVKVELAVDVDEEKINGDAEYTQSYFKSLQNLRSDWMEEFEKLSQQNSLYINMSSLVADTFTHVEKIYRAAQKDILNVGDEFSNAWNNVIEFGTTFANDRAKVQRNINDIFKAHRKRR